MCDIYFGVKACRWSNMICLSLDCVIFETKVIFLCTMYIVYIVYIVYIQHGRCLYQQIRPPSLPFREIKDSLNIGNIKLVSYLGLWRTSLFIYIYHVYPCCLCLRGRWPVPVNSLFVLNYTNCTQIYIQTSSVLSLE